MTHVTVLDLILSAPSRVHDPKVVNFFFLVNAQSFQPDLPRQPQLKVPQALMASNVFARLMPPSTFCSNHLTQGTSMLRDPSPVRNPKPGNIFFFNSQNFILFCLTRPIMISFYKENSQIGSFQLSYLEFGQLGVTPRVGSAIRELKLVRDPKAGNLFFFFFCNAQNLALFAVQGLS